MKEITENLNCSHWQRVPTGQRGPPVSDLKTEHGDRPALSHQWWAIRWNRPHLHARLTKPRRLVPMVTAWTHRSYLVTGHVGMAALHGGAPATTGHDSARREAHELHSVRMSLPRLLWLGEMRRRVLPMCMVARRWEHGSAACNVLCRWSNQT